MLRTEMTVVKVVAFLAVAICCLPGCGGGGTTNSNTPAPAGPAIANARVLPGTWSSGGGNATIQADVSDPEGVASVAAKVIAPSGTTTIDLALTSGSHYTAHFTVPANQTVGSAPQVYSVMISATDTAGRESSAPAMEFLVPAPSQPPAPPPSP